MSGDQNISNRLISAVSGGHLGTVKSLINSYGLSYSIAWSDGYVLLRDAIKRGHTEIAELLLTHGSKVNSKNSRYNPTDTPLHFAALGGNVNIVKMLLNKGANINAKNQDGRTPLFNVINNINYGDKQDKLEVTELLVKGGADVNTIDNSGTSPLHVAIDRGCSKIVELLLKYGAYVNCTTFAFSRVQPYIYKGHAPLHCAVERDLQELTTLLLNRDAEVDVKSENGITPLHIAAQNGYMHIAAELLNHGACVNSSTLIEGCTPLHFACGYRVPLPISERSNFEETVKFFLNKGADVNVSTKDNLTPLHIATKQRNTAIVKLLLQHGAKVDDEDKDGKTILNLAVEIANLIIVKDVLKYCPDVNNESNRSSLKVAVYGNAREIVQALLEYGINVDPKDTNNPEYFHAAIKKGYLKIVDDLLKYGTDVNMLYKTTCEEDFTPLHTAAKYEQHIIAKLLISYEADINAQDKSGKTPIFYAIQNADLKMTRLLLTNKANVKDDPELLNNAVKNKCIELVEALLQYDADINYINAQDKSGKTPIFYAIQNADLKMTRLLLNNKANVKDNPELLNNAVKKECIEIVEALLQYDADINYSDKYGRTALHFTTLMENEGFIDEFDTNVNAKLVLKRLSKFSFISESLIDTRGKMAKLLLSKGAKVNSQTKSGITTLYAAIRKGYTKVVEALLEYNANLNSAVKTDIIPLHLSAEIGNGEIVRMLLNKGADVNAKQKDGSTSLHIAVEECHNEVVKILLEYGANINSKCQYDMTPLHWGASKGNEKVVKTLLKFGADVELTDVNGCTALHIACKYAHAKVVETLLTYGSDINVVCRNNLTPLDYTTFSYRSFNAITALKCQIIKMKIVNLYVSEQNLLSIRSNDQIKDYEDECEKEIEKMKSEKINNAKISFYDILARDICSLVQYTRNENVVQILKSGDYKSKFPIYASMIKCYFRKVMKRKELLDQVKDIIYFVFNNLPELPDDCSDKILSYLSDEDLKIIMDACNKPLSDSNPHML